MQITILFRDGKQAFYKAHGYLLFDHGKIIKISRERHVVYIPVETVKVMEVSINATKKTKSN